MVPILIAIGVALSLMGLNAATVKVGPWYDALRKPGWNPPKWAFGPAWTVILSLAAIACATVWTAAPSADARTGLFALVAVNLILNGLWSQLFFNLRSPGWALAEIVLLLVSILSLIVTFAPVSPMAAALILPYLLWVMFASVLNFTIWRLNRLQPA